MAKLAKYLISEMFGFVFFKPTYCVQLLKQDCVAVCWKRMCHWDAFASLRFYIQDVIDIFDNNGIADSMKTRFLQLSWLMISAAMNRTRTKMINVLSQGATNTLNKHGKIRIYVRLPTLYERGWVLIPPQVPKAMPTGCYPGLRKMTLERSSTSWNFLSELFTKFLRFLLGSEDERNPWYSRFALLRRYPMRIFFSVSLYSKEPKPW